VLPRVRAILSWELPPAPGQPNWTPVWGGAAGSSTSYDGWRTALILGRLSALAASTHVEVPLTDGVHPDLAHALAADLGVRHVLAASVEPRPEPEKDD
jgi:hypothetical protein